MTTTTTKKAEIEKQKARLRQWLPKGATVFTILEKVSASGMSRQIRVVAFGRDDNGKVVLDEKSGEPFLVHPNHAVSVVLGYPRASMGKGEGVRVRGCGMDMGYHLVHNLSCALYDGDGYALNHRWL